MIIALGDSITFGSVGVSYLCHTSHSLINKGVNGDCISGAYKRLKKILNTSKYEEADTFIIEIGTNDVFLHELGNVSLFWKIHRFLRPRLFGHHYFTEAGKFQHAYEKILILLKKHNKKAVLVGLPKTEFKNKELQPLDHILENRNKIIKQLAKKYHFGYIDTYHLLQTLPQTYENIGYYWGKSNFMRIIDGTILLLCAWCFPSLNDLFSKARKLNHTMDGIHFNTPAAKILAKEIDQEINHL